MAEWPPDPALYPRIDAVFAFVQPSYDVMARRMDAISGRLSQLSAFVSAATFGAFALAVQAIDAPEFQSPWALSALVLAVAALVTGWVAQVRYNELVLLDPAKLASSVIETYDSPELLRAGMLYFAGEHFATNRTRIKRMWVAAFVMNGLLTLELACIAAWALPQL